MNGIPDEFLNKKTDIIIPGNSIVILNGNCIHNHPNNSIRSRPWFSSCYISEGKNLKLAIVVRKIIALTMINE